MSEKNRTFAADYDEPTALANSFYADVDTDDDDDDIGGALAFTDFTKPMPILEGEDAERFIRNMEENNRKAHERAKKPMTKEEAEAMLNYKLILLDLERNNIDKLEEEIIKLKEFINSK